MGKVYVSKSVVVVKGKREEVDIGGLADRCGLFIWHNGKEARWVGWLIGEMGKVGFGWLVEVIGKG